MGKHKALFKQCPGCTEFYDPKEGATKVAIRFRIVGKDMAFCASCIARERYKLEAWLAENKKTMRTEPKYDHATGRRTLILITDPQDYTETPMPEGEKRVGDDGLLLAPTQQYMGGMQH